MPVVVLKNVEKAAAEAKPVRSAMEAAVQPPSSQFLAASIFSCTIYLCGVSSISCRKQRLRRLKDKPEQICRNIEKYCPNAWLLNHTNPMVGLTMLHSLGSGVKNVGICHGVQTTAHEVAESLGRKDEEVTYRVAGINHLAWFLELQRTDSGKDLYPLLHQTLANPQTEAQKEFLTKEIVRIEILNRFGYFPVQKMWDMGLQDAVDVQQTAYERFMARGK